MVISIKGLNVKHILIGICFSLGLFMFVATSYNLLLIRLQKRRKNDMLLYELVERCHYRNENEITHEQCGECSYGCDCPRNCLTCLEYVHFPHVAPKLRTYDCTHMADHYYCKYSFRYASEIVYGLRQFADIREKTHLKVMSVGCGPCTELAAIDYMRQTNELEFETLEFIGIDPLSDVWEPIWADIEDYFGTGIRFLNRSILELIDVIVEQDWVPDLIIFQYVFSDMYKHNEQRDIEDFIEKLVDFLNEQTDKSIYILANDTNLSRRYSGGREFFDSLTRSMEEPKYIRRRHFDNRNRPNHYNYGDEYPTNALVFEDISREIQRTYDPFCSCASAQILIKKCKGR